MRKLKKCEKEMIFSLAGLLEIGVAAGLYLFLRDVEKEKDDMDDRIIKSNELIGEGSCPDKCDGMTPREKRELQERIKAMTAYEHEIILEVIPVSACMKRIQQELDHAREFETMIKKAYDMKQ